MGVYNVSNIQLVGMDYLARIPSDEELKNEFETGDIPLEKQTQEYREADKTFKVLRE